MRSGEKLPLPLGEGWGEGLRGTGCGLLFLSNVAFGNVGL